MQFINDHLSYVSWATVALLFIARLASKSGPPILIKLLPAWFDVTTWGKYGWLGTMGQLLVNVVLAGGTVLAASFSDGLTKDELYAAGKAVIEAIGIYHGIKLVLPNVAARKKTLKDSSATTTQASAAILLLVTAVGCGSLSQNEVVSTVLDQGQAVCQNELLRSDTPKMLIASGVLPDYVPAVIEATCAALPVAELVAQADRLAAEQPAGRGDAQTSGQGSGSQFAPAGSPRSRTLQDAARARGLLP